MEILKRALAVLIPAGALLWFAWPRYRSHNIP
jgi:hypothetical protein